MQAVSTIDPGPALLWFAGLVLALLLVFWPRHGLVARLNRLARMSDRVQLEDALKQLHHFATAGTSATVESLAGALELRRGIVVRIVERLAEHGLAESSAGRISLTPVGQAYGLRMVRTHRLWERYLADRTGLAPADWHDEAERQEHTLSLAQTEALAARMGDPKYDPHGDPIPSITGELPVPAGRPLSAIPGGAAATVLHLEDEPREAFQRLLDLGLRPGARLRLLSVSATEVRFRFDGREQVLPQVVADQVTAEPLPPEEVLDERPHQRLAELAVGQSAIVVRVAAACQGPQRRRLLDLGVVPGTRITAEFGSPGGDPTAYRIRGALIALRRSQAELIQVDPELAQAAS